MFLGKMMLEKRKRERRDHMEKRQIAIFTDPHALLEPTEAALQDIKRRGITEIYSLGDNIGVGPNPGEVIDLLEEYGVQSVAGNSEEYITLGSEPFRSYFDRLKEKSRLWTLSKLNEHQKGLISLYPHSIELLIGGKKLGLVHFANDVRFDFGIRSTWSYQGSIERTGRGFDQFLYTNSADQLEQIEELLNHYGVDSPMMRGYLSAKQDPLFALKRVDFFDAIIQGHVHFKIYERGGSTDFYSIRAVGMAYGKDPVDTASYALLTETETGYELEEVLVKYDREKMIYSILNSGSPDPTIQRFVNMGPSRRR